MEITAEDVIVRSMMLDYDSDELPNMDEDFDAWLEQAVPQSASDMLTEASAEELVPLLRAAATLRGPVYDRIMRESNVGWEHPDSEPELTKILNRLADEVEVLARA